MPIVSGQLLHSPADIFRHLLIDKGLGTEQSIANPQPWPIVVDTEIDLPDNFIAVTNTEGERYGRIQNTGEQPEHFGVQVKVRSSLPTVGWTKANLIAVAMDQQLSYNAVAFESKQYAIGAVTRKSGPMSIGREVGQTRRFIYTVNAVFIVHQTL